MTIQEPTTELTNQLKKLGLSGIVDSIDVRNQEAIANQLAYCEFLSLLLQDELLTRENRCYQRRLKLANLKGLKTIENFDFKFNPKINQALIRDLVTCRFIKERHPLLIIGPCGTGKSHLAQAIGLCAIRSGFDVICTTHTELSQMLQTARAVGNYANKLKSLTKVALLIIDDFGLKPLQSPQDEDLHALIAGRYEQAATIVTSNLALQEWQQAFPNQLLGAACIDRLQHNAYVLILDGLSYRAAKINKATKIEE
jgi:DNA replication protein DnaC